MSTLQSGPEEGSKGSTQDPDGQLYLFPGADVPKKPSRGPRTLPFKQLDPNAALPTAQHPGDAGLDLRSIIDVVVAPGERVMVPTGLAVAIPAGHAGLVLPRSGLAAKRGLTLANAPGLIDAGYRGEVICAVVNLDGKTPVQITKGERIAQLVVVAVPGVTPTWAEELKGSSRGGGGFGSTGTS